jgi:hypothetical protein
MSAKSKAPKTTSRRKFLLAAGATGVAVVAMPQVSRAAFCSSTALGLTLTLSEVLNLLGTS